MKIIIVGTAYPFRGGLAAYNERLARQLAGEGHDVRIITFSVQYPGFLFPGRTQYLDGPPPAELRITREVSSVNPLSWIKIGNKIKREKPDLLIFKYWLPFMAPCFGTIARLAKRNRQTRVICIFDNVIPHEKHPGDKLLTNYFVKPLDGAVAMSQSVLNDLAKFRKDIPARLNPHPLFDNFGSPVGREEALDKLGLEKSSRWILFFGFIRAYKGLDLLIEAFGEPLLRGKNLRLIVAGEFYEDDKPYREMVKKLNLGSEIVFFDRFINDDEVRYFFGSADLVVQPYRDATQSGVTQIAYHFGKPMVVTDVGGLREIVPDGKCGYVVKPVASDISAAIADFFDRGKRDLMTSNIEKERSRYSWSRMTGAISDIYGKIKSDDNKK